MKKRLLLLVGLLTLSAVLANPVTAQSITRNLYRKFVYYGVGAVGEAMIYAPGHPAFVIYEAVDLKYSSTFGPHHDALFIDIFGYLVVVTDNPEFAYLMDDIYGPSYPDFTVFLADVRDLEVWSSSTEVTAVLKLPFVCETPWGPVMIPAFTMRIVGSDCGELVKEDTGVMPSGYRVQRSMVSYEATATITSPDGSEWPALMARVGCSMTMAVS